ARQRQRQPSIRGLLVADALRSWVPPTAALVVLGAAMLLDALGLLPDRMAATIAVVALLVLGAFVAVVPLLDDDARRSVAPGLVLGVAALWIVVVGAPFA